MIRRKGVQEWTTMVIIGIILAAFFVIAALLMGWLDSAIDIAVEVAMGGG
ncbi:MAG: hypothetical protein MUP58_02470 [Candidatus Nanohaloarchaeota archaeon QJJ-9]|nr:hypothetical protein [Candidatus Nanohaloarchaeota archaeon QJJ-9]